MTRHDGLVRSLMALLALAAWADHGRLTARAADSKGDRTVEASAVEKPGQEPRHPLLAAAGRGDERLLKQFTDEEWLALVPRQSPRGGVLCPMDDGNPANHGWLWDPHQPDRITCDRTGEVFPSSKFPTKYFHVEVLSGKTVEIPYIEAPHRGRVHKIQIQARIDFEKFRFLQGALSRLGSAYAGTRDERYARIVALVLDAWANHVPDYFISGKGGDGEPVSPAEADKQSWFVSRVSDHNNLAHEWPQGCLSAFDCIHDSQSLEELSAKRGYDVRRHIAEHLFGNIGDMFVKRVKPEWAIRSNLSGPYRVLANAATILDRPDYIEYLEEYLQKTIEVSFVRDGMFPESFGYHRGYASENVKVVEAVSRYFAIHPAETDALRGIKARCDERLAFLNHTVTAPYPVYYPDGRLPPFGDTAGTNEEVKRDITRSALLPAYGFLVLGDGSGSRQTQLDLAFNESNNHCQDDTLAMTLFAFGAEVLGNNPYSRTAGRDYNNSSLSHNLVVIDRRSQIRPRYSPVSTGGSLTLYEPGIGGIAAAEVDGSRAYLGKASRYQRLIVLNTADPSHPYAIDLFAVVGGTVHDYLLHGATTYEQHAEVSIPTVAMDGPHPMLAAGENWKEPTEMGDNFPVYGMLVNMRRGRSPGDWNVTYRGDEQTPGARLFMVDDGQAEVFCGQSPVLYYGKELSGPRDATRLQPSAAYTKQLRPVTLVRRQSPDGKPLDSLFVGLIEPIERESAIESFERLPLAADDPDAVALRIRFTSGREDVLLVNLLNPRVAGCRAGSKTVVTQDKAFALRGRIGVSMRGNPDIERTVMIGADRFKAPSGTLSAEQPIVSGKLLGVQRRSAGDAADAFVTDAEVPEGKALRGRWLSLVFGTLRVAPDKRGNYPMGIKQQMGISQQFQIDRVERVDDRSVIHLADDPAIVMHDDTVTETMRPRRTFEGPCTLEIAISRCSP